MREYLFCFKQPVRYISCSFWEITEVTVSRSLKRRNKKGNLPLATCTNEPLEQRVVESHQQSSWFHLVLAEPPIDNERLAP